MDNLAFNTNIEYFSQLFAEASVDREPVVAHMLLLNRILEEFKERRELTLDQRKVVVELLTRVDRAVTHFQKLTTSSGPSFFSRSYRRYNVSPSLPLEPLSVEEPYLLASRTADLPM